MGERNGKVQVRLNLVDLEVEEDFIYLGSTISLNGRMEDEVNHRLNEGAKTRGQGCLWKSRAQSTGSKVGMLKGVIASTVL